MLTIKIGLHDAEKDSMRRKTFPNYALMKISAYHKSIGDEVDWWSPSNNDSFDKIYSSKVFNFTKENPLLPHTAIRGGTGYTDIPIDNTLPDYIDDMYPDYSIYPECDYAIGYLTRGCPNHCAWCVVPSKEGDIRPYRNWEDIVRSDTDKVVLMDNNILASEHGIEQLKGFIGSGYNIDLNQGMDARLVTPEIAEIISKLKWTRYIRFSCDQISQLDAIDKTLALLLEHGVKPYRVFLYILVTKNIDDAVKRVEHLKQYKGLNLYAQAERNEGKGITPNRFQLEFAQRYIYGRCYKKETWDEYLERNKDAPSLRKVMREMASKCL